MCVQRVTEIRPWSSVRWKRVDWRRLSDRTYAPSCFRSQARVSFSLSLSSTLILPLRLSLSLPLTRHSLPSFSSYFASLLTLSSCAPRGLPSQSAGSVRNFTRSFRSKLTESRPRWLHFFSYFFWSFVNYERVLDGRFRRWLRWFLSIFDSNIGFRDTRFR